MELGHEEAASAAPALGTRFGGKSRLGARTYLKDHPEDVAARKQLEDLHAPSEVRTSSEQPKADSREKSSAAASAKPAPRPGDTLWLPPDVDENVPPVEPGAACSLEEVLERAGKRIQEFVGNVDRFTATEFLQHETLARSGNVTATQKRKYDYVVSITEVRPGVLDLQEYESSGSTPADAPGGMTTRGLPALVLIFHPYYSGTFAMKCEGLATWNGTRTWQVYFRQREDQPNKIRAYRIGLENYPVALKGRAWIVADSYQILGVQTDLIAGVPDIRLTAEHTAIQYGPVHFASRGVDMWLPQTAEVYSERKGKRIHRRLSFTNYLLFAVDEKQQIATPSSTPITPPAPVSTMASVRNCQMMSRFRAPMAMRTPISRVRCVTDISMMFITPTPPTSRPIELTTEINRATEAVIWRNWSAMAVALEMPKLSGLS